MSFINQITLVGWLVEKPEIRTSAAGKRYALVKLQTGRPIKGPGGKTKWVYSTHRIIVFELQVIKMFEKGVEPGDWFKVNGELTYMRETMAQIVVDGVHGHFSRMFKDVWKPVEFATDAEIEAANAMESDPIDEIETGGDAFDTSTSNGFGGSGGDDDDDIPF